MLIRFVVVFGLVVGVGAVSRGAERKDASGAPVSSYPALDRAGVDLAEGRPEAAREEFEKALKDPSAPAFVRGLAQLGLAETALARKDMAEAMRIWRRMAEDKTLPQAYRDSAQRKIVETERLAKRLAARDPVQGRVALPELGQPAVIFHVAPGGNGDGSEARPLGSLEAARDAVRAWKKARGGKAAGGVRVVVSGGVYRVRETVKLAAEDSGAADGVVVYQAKDGQRPIFTGGLEISAWKKISDAKMREKLDPAVRDRVLEANLGTLGVKDWGDATALKQRPELFCDGVPQTLARWPNEGFVKTGQVPGELNLKAWDNRPGNKAGRFHYVEDRPGTWLDEPDVRLYGYWFWDWFEEYQKVATIDANQRVFTLAQPWSHYGYRKDQRYHALNVFRELDAPGEWYLDRRSGVIYWLPPAGTDPAKAVTTLSILTKPFVAMENVQHVALVGLTFEEGRDDGVIVRGGADCLIAGCTLRQLGGDAVVVSGGKHHGVFGCTMHTLGCGGMRVAGGDRNTLTAGNHFVENCTVYDISRLKRTYAPAVHLDGCGNRVAHNLFEKIPSSAMRIEGNDHLIELNVIRNVVRESDDQGGIDMFGNPLYRGVVIRWNRWSDITGGTHCGAAGVRLDDMISGITVQGNIFERCGAVLFGGVQIHGGKENVIDNNVFVDCFAGVSFSRWGEKRWLQMIEKFVSQAGREPYSTRYPDLARLKENADVNYLSRNVYARCGNVYLRDGGIQKSALGAVVREGIDPKTLSDGTAVAANAQLRRALFDAIPVDEIGPYLHPWRATDTGR